MIRADGTREQGPVTASAWFAELAVGPTRRVALLGADDELLIWDRSTGEEIRLEADPHLRSMCWAPDETALHCLSDREGIRSWDGQEWRSFDLP